MGKYHFAIVKFINEDDALGIVASKWVSRDNSYCYYPNVTTDEKKDRLLRMEAEPTSEWLEFPIIVMHKYETYSDARMNLKKAEETSNLDTDGEENTLRRRKPRNLYLPGEESSNDTLYEPNPPPKRRKQDKSIPAYPVLKSVTSPDTSTSINSIISFESLSNSQVSPSSQKNKKCTNGEVAHPVRRIGPTKHSESTLSAGERIMLGQLQGMLADINDKVINLTEKVDLILKNQGYEATEGIEDDDCLLLGSMPMKSMEDFESFEMQLKKKGDSFTKKFMKILITVGGRDMKCTILNTMRRLMTDQLAVQFSYTGKSTGKDASKKTFSGTEICKFVHMAVHKVYKQATDDKIKEVICVWFQQAKTRVNRRDQKTPAKTMEGDKPLEV